MELQASPGRLGAEGDCGMSNLLVPSPQSEAVTHEMEELSLQPTQSLPPLNERKNVLQLRLQQRRTREQLVDQGIMPPKCDVLIGVFCFVFFPPQTENFLKHKIRSRPERAELVRMHILQETGAEPSLQATQMKLKRARLADNLNEKIAQRPGPMELVEKNIIPVDSSLKEAIIVGQVNYTKVLDEDSCEALSPEQPASQESQGSASSPLDSRVPETPSPSAATIPAPILQVLPTTDCIKRISTNEQPPISFSFPVCVPPRQQSQQKTPSEKSRSKKNKELKSRVKKLKYHQYVPPDQKQEPSEAPMDSSYARLLQQQQLFLQLQILSQQQQHYNYHAILPAPLKAVAESPSNSVGKLPASIVVSLPAAAPPPPQPQARPNSSVSSRKPGVLTANLEEMKVTELKSELKLRGLPVSGTKTDLIERLKPFQDVSTASAAASVAMEVTPTTTPAIVLPVQKVAPESVSSTPPVSPAPADPASLQLDVTMSEAPAEIQKGGFGPAGPRSSPQPSFRVPEEKDRRLHEKERQIEELMRKLEQEQRLVEELKMQLEVEKRGQVGCGADSATSVSPIGAVPAVLNSNEVKMEGPVLPQLSPGLQQFFISHPGGVSQVLGQPQTLLTTGQASAQLLFPVSLPNNATAIQLPATTVSLQPVLQATVSNPGVVQAPVPQLQTNKMELTTSPQPLLQTLTMCNNTTGLGNHARSEIHAPCFLRSSPENRVSPQASPNHQVSNGPLNKSPSPQPGFVLQPTSLVAQPPKTREPPRYEEAVKQTRNMYINSVSQVSTATSQHMDDLFDILIESGEITPFIQQDPQASLSKTLPVTANITILPVNTALSRPPPQVQVAPPPTLSPAIAPTLPGLSPLGTDNQLEAFLEGTLAGSPHLLDPRTQGLMEELQAQLEEQQPYSPMDTSELSFCDPSLAPSSLGMGLADPALDNMEWLDLTMPPGPAGAPLTPLGMPTDFLDTQDLQLHWE
uniref:Myocardin related transcription factor B n=1 Tax=Kryptolebias marmoratus TaxID=37003 RepID=A0A3Q3BRV4_KRYMA